MSVRGDTALRILPLGEDAFRLSSGRHTYARLLEPHAASRELMRKWLSTCETSHQPCIKYEKTLKSQPKVHRNLIDVKDMCVRDSGGDFRRYFALSYVWGQVESLHLLQKNISELAQPGSLENNIGKLCRVVKNAIVITRELGERFLWVDSLCICQDDLRNKASHISNMNHIYKQAVVTLVALHTANASSFLPGVEPYERTRLQRIERIHFMRMTTLLPDVSELKNLYASRAWTYQEELLSRRLLYFSEHQVYFCCLRSNYSEDTYEDDPDHWYCRSGQLLTDFYPYTLFEWWKKTVSEYSTRLYTFPADRYDAFDGVANEVAERWNYSSIHGLPVNHFISALCWQHKYDGGAASRNVCYPSWSWCGWTDGIIFLETELQPKMSSSDWGFAELNTVLGKDYRGNQDRGEPMHQRMSTSSEAFAESLQDFIIPSAILEEGLSVSSRISVTPRPHALSFLAFSALLLVKINETGEEIYDSIGSSITKCGFISPSQSSGKLILEDSPIYRECILVATFEQDQSTQQHKHFQTAEPFRLPFRERDFRPRVRERTQNLVYKAAQHMENILERLERLDPDQGFDSDLPPAKISIACIMLIEHRENHYERIAMGQMNEHCFWNFHPIQRHIRLG
ncbi:hypothetical protein MMC11_002349 [Xylographa trunciseda]|nr:hypothetical protein [Xylographa trunciseda]